MKVSQMRESQKKKEQGREMLGSARNTVFFHSLVVPEGRKVSELLKITDSLSVPIVFTEIKVR